MNLINRALLIFLLLSSIHFWRFIYIPSNFFNLTDVFALLILGFSTLKVIQADSQRFKNAIIIFFIGLIVNIFSAYIHQDQSIRDSFLAFGSYYFILFYFYLHYNNVNRAFLERLILIMAISYSAFYIIQYIAFPSWIFNVATMHRGRGTIRILIEGNGFLVLGYFLSLNRYVMNRQIKYLLFSLGFFTILLLGGFRTMIFAVTLLSGFLLIKLIRYSIFNYVLIFIAAILIIGLFQFEGTSTILNEMIRTTTTQIAEGKEYIRLIEFDYFFYKYPKSISYFLIGGGIPGGTSTYGYFMRYIAGNYGLYWVDLGILGFYIIIGLPALIGLLWYSIKAIFTKVPSDMIYLNIYFAYLLLVSFTTMEIYRNGIFAVQALVLYLIDKSDT